MRDIRFKVWEKPQEGFKGKMWTDDDPKFWAECLMNKKDEYELLQFTGLKDKNGVSIYEGDIVKFWDDNLVGSKWRKEEVMWRNYQWIIYGTEYINDKILEVIGNIYENGDLLAPKE